MTDSAPPNPFALAAVNLAGIGPLLSGAYAAGLTEPPTFTGEVTSGSLNITLASSTVGLFVGMPITATGNSSPYVGKTALPGNSTISGISGSTVTFTNVQYPYSLDGSTEVETGPGAPVGAFFSGSVLVTAAVPPLGGAILQAGTTTVSFSSGVGTLTFPNAFPNGLIAVVATPVIASVEVASVSVDSASLSLSAVELVADVGGSAASGNLTVSWIALGC